MDGGLNGKVYHDKKMEICKYAKQNIVGITKQNFV